MTSAPNREMSYREAAVAMNSIAQHAVPNIHPHPYTQYEPQGGWIPWDPSFNQPHYGLDQARRLGRCVEDLGYGRYEYCD